jgi:TonB dependent receptor/TonB-dependent Receptor Plug Domain
VSASYRRSPRILHHCARLSVLLALLCGAAASQAAPWAGMPMSSLLRALQRSGVNVLYSSELVPEQLRIEVEPGGATLLSQTSEALTAHRLELQSVGPGRYLVVQAALAATGVAAAGTASVGSVRPNGSAHALAEVVVFASRYAFDDRNLAASSALTRNQVEQIPGSENDALRAVQSLPGIAAGDAVRPYIRGSGPDDVLVLFDHVALAEPFHLRNFQNLMSAFDSSVIDRLEVYSGGFPVQFGTRSGGVIDITPRSSTGGHEYAAGIGLKSLQVSSLGKSGTGSLEWLAAVRRSVPNVVVEADGGGFDRPAVFDAVGRMRWQIGPASAWIAGALLLDDRIGLKTESGEVRAEARYRDSYAWLAFERQPPDAWHSRTTVSLAHSERSRNGAVIQPQIIRGALEESRDFLSVALASNWIYERSGRERWNVGFELGHTTGDNAYAQSQTLTPATASAFGRSVNTQLVAGVEPRSTHYATFASVYLQPTARLDTEIGLRLDGQHYHAGVRASQLAPRFNLRYQPMQQLSLYASWGLFAQAQRPDEWRLEENQQLPDPAQIATHEVVGLSYGQSGASSWHLEFYRKHWNHASPYFDNQLNAWSLLSELSPDRLRIAPLSSESKGLELSLRGSFADAYQYWGSYTWSTVTDELSSGDIARNWDQRSAVTGGVSWKKNAFSASTALRYHSGWPRTPVTLVPRFTPSAALVALGTRNSARWADYLSIDMRAAWTRTIGSNEWEVFTELSNVTNRSNDCCLALGLASPGAVAIAEIGRWQPRTLNVGVSWRVR